MSSQQCPFYDSQSQPPWLHVLYGYGGPHSRKQELLLAPSERFGLPAHLLYLLSDDLGRLESNGAFALAFANLSRRAPGRHCLAIYVASRVAQGIDEVGRSHSAFKHAAVACERQLDAQILLQAGQAMLQSIGGGEAPRKSTSHAHETYRRYLAVQQSGKSQAKAALEALVPYVQGIELGSAPPPEVGELPVLITASGHRVCYITYPRGHDLMSLLEPAARIAATLHQAGPRSRQVSALAWTSVELGASHPLDPSDGITIRFVAEDELPADSSELRLPLSQLPPWREDEGYGRELFELLSRGGRREPTARAHDTASVPPPDSRNGNRDTLWHPILDEADRSKRVVTAAQEPVPLLALAAGSAIRGTGPMSPISPPHGGAELLLPKILRSQPVLRPGMRLRRIGLRVLYGVISIWALVVLAASLEILSVGISKGAHSEPVPIKPAPAPATVPHESCACPAGVAPARPSTRTGGTMPAGGVFIAPSVAGKKEALSADKAHPRPDRGRAEKAKSPQGPAEPDTPKPAVREPLADRSPAPIAASTVGSAVIPNGNNLNGGMPIGNTSSEAVPRPLPQGGGKSLGPTLSLGGELKP